MTKPFLLTLAGTRPELIKLAPLIELLKRPSSPVGTYTCFSGQHTDLLASVVDEVNVRPDIDFRAPPANRSLTQGLAWLLERVDDAIKTLRPDGVVVQGDTNTVLAGAMTAHHYQIPCFHVEAGLRTSNRYGPFPEEMNRRLATQLSALHFAPTARARENLLAEGIAEDTIQVTGNTGVDALHLFTRARSVEAEKILATLDPTKKNVLVTLHRRENATSVERVTSAVRRLVATQPGIQIVWILHVNGIRKQVEQALEGHPSVRLLDPQPYRAFVHLMRAAHIIMTDSGGVQEEAPVLGKPVLVLREQTERAEAIEAGSARLVGCDTEAILRECKRLLHDHEAHEAMSRPRSPFGDGFAAKRIVDALCSYYRCAPASWSIMPPARVVA